jgi:3-methyladenine DNA glycosylase Tag
LAIPFGLCLVLDYLGSSEHDNIILKEYSLLKGKEWLMIKRCEWARDVDPLYTKYHDEEWGVPEWRLLKEPLIKSSFRAKRSGDPESRPAQDVPVTTAASAAMSKALKKRGFKFVGSTICYAFMQAVGMVNDHTTVLLLQSIPRLEHPPDGEQAESQE